MWKKGKERGVWGSVFWGRFAWVSFIASAVGSSRSTIGRASAARSLLFGALVRSPVRAHPPI